LHNPAPGLGAEGCTDLNGIDPHREQHRPDAERSRLRQRPELIQLLDLYARLTGVYSRVLEKLGLDRAQKPVETLASFIREIEAERADKADAVDAESDA
jgi:hypothetical protein